MGLLRYISILFLFGVVSFQAMAANVEMNKMSAKELKNYILSIAISETQSAKEHIAQNNQLEKLPYYQDKLKFWQEDMKPCLSHVNAQEATSCFFKTMKYSATAGNLYVQNEMAMQLKKEDNFLEAIDWFKQAYHNPKASQSYKLIAQQEIDRLQKAYQANKPKQIPIDANNSIIMEIINPKGFYAADHKNEGIIYLAGIARNWSSERIAILENKNPLYMGIEEFGLEDLKKPIISSLKLTYGCTSELDSQVENYDGYFVISVGMMCYVKHEPKIVYKRVYHSLVGDYLNTTQIIYEKALQDIDYTQEVMAEMKFVLKDIVDIKTV